MPNHIFNRITGSADVLDKLLAEDGSATFTKVIPYPHALFIGDVNSGVEDWARIALGIENFKNEVSDRTSIQFVTRNLQLHNLMRCLERGPYPKDFSPKYWANFIAMMESYRATKHLHSFSWSIENYGTKWGPYNSSTTPETISFQTAWSAPHPVIEKIKGVSFTHQWADEDTGRNVGVRRYGPDGFSETILDDTREGYELAFKLGAADASDYVLVNNKYRHAEEETAA
jgi:Ferredoxin-like domain in Api92-like protein